MVQASLPRHWSSYLFSEQELIHRVSLLGARRYRICSMGAGRVNATQVRERLLVIRKRRKTVVVIGNGMVGHRFCERLVEFDAAHDYQIVTFCEEPRPAYDRVNLTKYFEHRRAEKLALATPQWYDGQRHHACSSATGPPRSTATSAWCARPAAARSPTTAWCWRPARRRSCRRCRASTRRASSSTAPSRTWSRSSPTAATVKKAAVIGGGLLGLEAAKAAYDLGLETHVVEFAPRLMPRQIDDAGSQGARRQDQRPGRPGPPQQEHQGNPRQRQGRGHGLRRRRRAGREDGRRLGRHQAARRPGPRLRPDGRPARRRRRR